jgi:hypothetical protein
VIRVIEANQETFETIAEQADDPEVARRFGRRPLQLLKLEKEGQA